MRTVVILSMLLFVNGANAQSKKKINSQLSAQLVQVTAMYDSILEKDNFFRDDNRIMLDEIESLRAQLREKRTHALASLVAISIAKEELRTDKYDTESIIAGTELEKMLSDLTKMDYEDELQKISDTAKIPQTDHLPDLTGYKIKVQNELLKAKIDEYNNINDLLMKDLISQALMWDKLRDLKNRLSEDLEKTIAIRSGLNSKMELLRNAKADLAAKKETERLKAMEQALTAENKKDKNSKAKVKFIPPAVIDTQEDKYMEEPAVMQESSAYGQEGSTPVVAGTTQEEVIYDVIEEQAEFPGGKAAMAKYLLENIDVPEIVQTNYISGKCYIKFVISETGQISNVTAVRGVPGCKECDAEAIRVIRQMPAWKPAKIEGRAVSQWFTIPVKFVPNE